MSEPQRRQTDDKQKLVQNKPPTSDVILKKVEQAKKTGVLALRECGLKEVPHVSVSGELEAVRTIDISNNQLKMLPAGVGGWTGLQNLNASQNTISALPESLGELVGLQKLQLGSNRLVSLPSSLGRLQKLRLFQLSGNKIGPQLPEDIFRQMVDLEELELSDNALVALPETFGVLRALTRLLVARNNLTALPVVLGDCTKLQYLDAAENSITAVPPAILEGTSLSELWLKGNPMERLELQKTDGFAAFMERRKLRIDHKIEAHVVGAIDLAVCGLE